MEFCALSHAESARHIAPDPSFWEMQFVHPDGSLGHPDQLGEAPLAVDQRQVAQVAAVMLNQVGGDSTAALAPQRHEILAYAVYR